MPNKNGNALVVILIVVCVIVAIVFFAGRSDNTSPLPANPVTGVLEFSVRYSLLVEKTGVLQIKNRTSSPIAGVTIQYYNQDSEDEHSYTVGTISSWEQKEVGVLESGWVIEPNEVVVVGASGYDSVALYFWNDQQGELRWSEGYGKKKLEQFLLKMKDALK